MVKLADVMKRKWILEYPTDGVITLHNFKDAFEFITGPHDLDFNTYYVMDGDLGSKKGGLNLVKIMNQRQKERTLFVSNNPVLMKQAINMEIAGYDKNDFVTGLKLLISKNEGEE